MLHHAQNPQLAVSFAAIVIDMYRTTVYPDHPSVEHQAFLASRCPQIVRRTIFNAWSQAAIFNSPIAPTTCDPQNPSSIPTFLHQRSPSGADGFTSVSASPTCRRSLTSRFETSLSRMALEAIVRLCIVKGGCCLFRFGEGGLVVVPTRVNPWDHSSLMTGRCHCSGSDDEERRFRWR